jgi:hypothetical protein
VVSGASEIMARMFSSRTSLMPLQSLVCFSLITCYLDCLLRVMVIAFVGHKSAHTPHWVQSESLVTWGFLFAAGSKMPWGQTPMQVDAKQGAHLVWSIDMWAFCLSM